MPTPPLLGIKETCLYVADTEHTRVFYADRLGLECFNHQPGPFTGASVFRSCPVTFVHT